MIAPVRHVTIIFIKLRLTLGSGQSFFQLLSCARSLLILSRSMVTTTPKRVKLHSIILSILLGFDFFTIRLDQKQRRSLHRYFLKLLLFNYPLLFPESEVIYMNNDYVNSIR